MNTYILFHNSSEAIWASRVLKKNSIEHFLVSVPRNLSSDCGYCVNLSENCETLALETLNKASVPYDRSVHS